MIITVLCPSTSRPIGGNIALYHFANGLARRGHKVQILHLHIWEQGIHSLDEVAWFRFEPSIDHYYGHTVVPVPRADAVIGAGAPAEMGPPVLIVQGIDMLHPWLERQGIRTPSAKVCVASWLIDVGELYGISRDQWSVVPCGIDHDTFRVLAPGAERPIDVSVLYHYHGAKGWEVASAALNRLRAERPHLRIAVFGATVPPEPLPEGASFHLAPDHPTLARVIYNQSRVFLQASHYEGFGFTAVEAMACGCALVTTDNGGSRDYADHDRTALVSPPGDAAALAANVAALLDDDEQREAMAEAGRKEVQRFDWDHSAELLEAAIIRFLADPQRYLVEPGEDRTLDLEPVEGAIAAVALEAGRPPR